MGDNASLLVTVRQAAEEVPGKQEKWGGYVSQEGEINHKLGN